MWLVVTVWDNTVVEGNIHIITVMYKATPPRPHLSFAYILLLISCPFLFLIL